ncbi:MAG: phosphatase PAP2 family protein, partial [Polyangiaceae bacterium]
LIVLLALAFGYGPGREHSIGMVATDLMLYLVGLVVTRGGLIKRNTSFGEFLNAFVYRMTLFAAIFLSYFQLRSVLAAVTVRTADAQIYAFDLHVFGFEPSLAWDRFVTPQTTEWFAFFYFGYFAILAIHVLPFVFGVNNERLISQFAIGIFTVFCGAHSLYMAVPGYGPYHFLASDFHHELTGGTFWGLVRETVDGLGAQKDIFPSLHTAAPTFFAMFSYRHRDKLPFKYTWPLVAFCAVQIIGATMFLRWHYLIDICAGLTLATVANLLGAYMTPWEIARRKRLGIDPIFAPLHYPSPRRLIDGTEGAEQPAE